MESALTSSAHHHASTSESSKFHQATQCFIDPSLTDESDKQRARAGINQFKQLLLPEVDLAPCAEHCEQKFKTLSVADFVLKIVPFLAFVRLKIVPFLLKIVPFLSVVRLKIVPFYY